MKQRQKLLLLILSCLVLQTGNVWAEQPDERVIVEEVIIGGEEEPEEMPRQEHSTAPLDAVTFSPAEETPAKQQPAKQQPDTRSKKDAHKQADAKEKEAAARKPDTPLPPQTVSVNAVFHTPAQGIEANSLYHAYLYSFQHGTKGSPDASKDQTGEENTVQMTAADHETGTRKPAQDSVEDTAEPALKGQQETDRWEETDHLFLPGILAAFLLLAAGVLRILTRLQKPYRKL